MKKFLLVCFLFIIFFQGVTNIDSVSAESTSVIYQIYDEYENLITEREDVELGDKLIDRFFKEYEIYLKDEKTAVAKARFVKAYKKPKIEKKKFMQINDLSDKKIALYMTHNDESYILGDGTESVYGAGGIHDIAKELKVSLNKLGIDVELDETLHIPHNSSAYNRSAVTAKRLFSKKPDAIFDIHRDGANRSFYITNVNGENRSKIRIVLGQANPNASENLQFAMYLMSVAEVECPWLFEDIYWGKGHYNQALSNKALLFEMGTHTIEKDYVIESARELAKIINTTLYDTTVNEENQLEIGNTQMESNPTVNEKLEQNTNNRKVWIILLPTLTVIILAGIATFIFYKKMRKRK